MKLSCVFVLCGSALVGAAAQSEAEPVRWSGLEPRIAGREISIALEGGGAVRGRAQEVSGDSIRIQVRQTNDALRYPMGEQDIIRSAVSRIRVHEVRGTAGRAVGTTVGAVAGFVGGLAAAYAAGGGIAHSSRARDNAVVFGVMGGAGVAGYALGKKLDQRTVELRILEEVGRVPTRRTPSGESGEVMPGR